VFNDELTFRVTVGFFLLLQLWKKKGIFARFYDEVNDMLKSHQIIVEH